MPKAVVIMCGVCNHPVDRTISQPDYATGKTVFIVKCHGEWDRCAIDNEIFKDGWELSSATAFVKKEQTKTVITPNYDKKLPVVISKFTPELNDPLPLIDDVPRSSDPLRTRVTEKINGDYVDVSYKFVQDLNKHVVVEGTILDKGEQLCMDVCSGASRDVGVSPEFEAHKWAELVADAI